MVGAKQLYLTRAVCSMESEARARKAQMGTGTCAKGPAGKGRCIGAPGFKTHPC